MKKGVTYLQEGQVQVRHSANVTQTLARLVVATDSPISTLARYTASVSSAPAIVNLVGCVGRGSVGGCVRDFSERIVKMKTSTVLVVLVQDRQERMDQRILGTARSGGGGLELTLTGPWFPFCLVFQSERKRINCHRSDTTNQY